MTANNLDVSWSMSTIAVPPIGGAFAWDNDIVKFVGGFFAADTLVQAVAYGVTKDDDSTHTSTVNTPPMHIVRGNSIYDAFANPATRIYPVRHLTKRQCWDILPPDLADLAFSCRIPTYSPDGQFATTCGRCVPCTATATWRSSVTTTRGAEGTILPR
jgi:hypothetical protein